MPPYHLGRLEIGAVESDAELVLDGVDGRRVDHPLESRVGLRHPQRVRMKDAVDHATNRFLTVEVVPWRS